MLLVGYLFKKLKPVQIYDLKYYRPEPNEMDL